MAEHKAQTAYRVSIVADQGVIGFAQSLTGATQRRGTKVIRRFIGGEGGEFGSVKGDIDQINADQVPLPPDYSFRLNKVVVVDRYSGLLNQFLGNTTDDVKNVAHQVKMFKVIRIRYDLNGTMKSRTTWYDCMVTDYDLGDDKVEGGEIIENVSVTALSCKTETF